MKCLICGVKTLKNKNTTKSYACSKHMTIAGTYGYFIGKEFYLSKAGKKELKKVERKVKSVI